MALLGIIKKFEATHGSRKIRTDEFRIELTFEGEIEAGFVAGIDYDAPKQRIEEVLEGLTGEYLDDIVGRATNENIGLYILYKLRDFVPHSLKVYEGDEQYVEVFFSDLDVENYPAQLCFNKAQRLLYREKPEAAIAELEQAIAARSDFAEAYNLRGRCYKYMERYDLALADYQKATEINPVLGDAWRNIGNAYLYLDRFDLMIPAFDRAIKLMPDSALAWNNRGFAYQKLKQYELAERDHLKAVEIDPHYAEAHRDLADAYDALGKGNLARRERETADELNRTGKDTFAGIKMY